MPTNGFDKAHPVTLRGLLSMTAGIGVPGFLGYAEGALPHAERDARESLALPIFPELTRAQLERVAGTILDFLR